MQTIDLRTVSRELQRITYPRQEARMDIECTTYNGDSFRIPTLKRPPNVELAAKGSIAKKLYDAYWAGQEVNLLLPERVTWKAFVVSARPGEYSEFELRCTGSPTKHSRDLSQVKTRVFCGFDYGTAPGRTVITSLPKPPAGTVAQHIYGVPVLQSALDKMREHIKVSTQLAVQRATEDLIYGHPNCRCLPVGITSTPKKEKRMKVRNKFYVAAPSVTTHSEQDQDNIEKNVHLSTSPNDRSGKWTRKDLAAAIEHAQTMLEADPSKDHVAIVKIVKLVRRPKPKFIVEDVK